MEVGVEDYMLRVYSEYYQWLRRTYCQLPVYTQIKSTQKHVKVN